MWNIYFVILELKKKIIDYVLRWRKRSLFIPIPKKGNAKECSNYCTIAPISLASKGMLKILQVRLKQYLNWELLDVQARFRKGRGTRDQIANICWITEKARELKKKSASFTMLKSLTVYITTNWGIFLEIGILDHLTCLLCAGQEATITTVHGKMDWFKIGKEVCQGLYCHPAHLTYM